MAYKKSDWECGVCKKNLLEGPMQCYLGKKYCHGECILKAFVIDENMDLYRVIEKNISKREMMQRRIDAKYKVESDEDTNSFDWIKELMGWS